MDRLSLEEIFSERPSQLRDLAEECEWIFPFAEELLHNARVSGVLGVEKVGDVGSAGKFRALLSEVYFGFLFAEQGMSARLLADEEFGRGTYTPDVLVERDDGFRALVEVVRGSSGDTDLVGPLQEAIERAGLVFRVEVQVGEQLSHSRTSYETRSAAEEAVEELVREIISQLSKKAPDDHGELQIGAHRVMYRPAEPPPGYAGGGSTTIHFLDSDSQRENFDISSYEKPSGRSTYLRLGHGRPSWWATTTETANSCLWTC